MVSFVSGFVSWLTHGLSTLGNQAEVCKKRKHALGWDIDASPLIIFASSGFDTNEPLGINEKIISL